ncbi:putative MPP superfamily phosphohydrolase [Isoptericola jiangsuensis]|uniref:Putative MPP superfamily phosphohydrolase n=1 Tax=Isoptericola jiangsuensis TaxID=548579 RepID=A0A2A9F1P5_9MICO|nr:metallophosphoesterase [Isoptericola jiangsuensis]PFG44462.1 putative MPP superfamily phosphohydrolase [Isoptericola jiangsuensis]
MLGGVAGVAAAGLAYAHLETKLFTLRRVTVPVLAPGERDVRVLQVSDLHLTPGQRRKIEWVRSLAALEPDLVVDTGDNLAHPDALDPLLHALEPLTAFPGAFVMGSNDYYSPTFKNPARYLLPDARSPIRRQPDLPADELAKALSAAGWADLTNRRDVVEVHGRPVSLTGVDDPHIDRDVYPAPQDAPPGTVLRLGVTHAPYVRVLDEMHADDVDAIIAGHTHGGQLCLPFYGALVTNCDVDRRRAKGLHGWPGPRPDERGGQGSTWLHVSAGAGTSPYAPVRFACRPEATLITFTAR